MLLKVFAGRWASVYIKHAEHTQAILFMQLGYCCSSSPHSSSLCREKQMAYFKMAVVCVDRWMDPWESPIFIYLFYILSSSHNLYLSLSLSAHFQGAYQVYAGSVPSVYSTFFACVFFNSSQCKWGPVSHRPMAGQECGQRSNEGIISLARRLLSY